MLGKRGLPLTGTLGDFPASGWARDIDQMVFRGNPLIEEVIFFHRGSRTLILDDLIQISHRTDGKRLRSRLLRVAGVAYPYGGVPLDIEMSFIDRDRARESLERLLSWDFDKVIIAHGRCIEHDGKEFIEHAFRWLLRH